MQPASNLVAVNLSQKGHDPMPRSAVGSADQTHQHGIDATGTSLGFAIVTEWQVLSQWWRNGFIGNSLRLEAAPAEQHSTSGRPGTGSADRGACLPPVPWAHLACHGLSLVAPRSVAECINRPFCTVRYSHVGVSPCGSCVAGCGTSLVGHACSSSSTRTV